METIDYPKLTTTEVVKIRFADLKITAIELGITQNLFREYVFANEPSYNCPEGWERIKITWAGRCADIRLTELLQEMITTKSF